MAQWESLFGITDSRTAVIGVLGVLGMLGVMCVMHVQRSIAALTIIFFHLPGKEDSVSQELHRMMGQLGRHCAVRGYGFGSCSGAHVVFGILGHVETADVREILAGNLAGIHKLGQ